MNSAPDPTRDALYAAILAHPDEDTPRLMYADHVEEHGEPARAEFIRLQCRLATMNEWDEGATALDVRCRRLLAEHPEWYESVRPVTGDRGLKGAWGDPVFRRGFAEHGAWPGAGFCSELETAFRSVPLRSADLHAGGLDAAAIGRLNGCAALSRLRRLSAELEPGALGAFAGVPNLTGLERLRVSVCASELSPLRPLVESPHLRNLRALGIVCDPSVSDHSENAGARAQWKWLPNLRELVFHRRGARDEFCARLFATGAWLSPLERLSMPAGWLDSGARVFAAIGDGLLDNLTDLDHTRVQGRATVFAPLRGLDRPRLRSLRLSELRPCSPSAGPAQPDELFHAPWLGGLCRLELPHAEVDDSWLLSLSTAPFARSLRSLDLTNARFTPTGYRVAIGPNSWWPNLRRLYLGAPQCPEDVLTGLLENPGMSNLVGLTAGQGKPAPKFLRRLAESPASARFRELDLAVKLDDAAAAALYRSPHLENVDLLRVVRGTAGRGACNRLTRRFGARITIRPNR
ncbi:MAG: TIGR02996 domain-containing protein [Planctomycetes bacterium]|nr:TIGR02996 domain-containing protein [Planctomycetota bacterium]